MIRPRPLADQSKCQNLKSLVKEAAAYRVLSCKTRLTSQFGGQSDKATPDD